jgi:long-chain acyl-CoA synthetase
VRERPSKVAVGWRDVVKVHEEVKEVTKTVGGKETTETKTWQFFELSPYKTMTYGELGEKIKNAASGLIETGHSRDTIFNVYSQTSVNWQIMAQGAFPSLLSSPSLCSLHSFHAY